MNPPSLPAMNRSTKFLPSPLLMSTLLLVSVGLLACGGTSCRASEGSGPRSAMSEETSSVPDAAATTSALQAQVVYLPSTLRVYLVDRSGAWIDPEGVSGTVAVVPRKSENEQQGQQQGELRHVPASGSAKVGYLESDYDFTGLRPYEARVTLDLLDLPHQQGRKVRFVRRFAGISKTTTQTGGEAESRRRRPPEEAGSDESGHRESSAGSAGSGSHAH